MVKISTHNLELHVTHACNLRCDNCSHFSNLGLQGHLSLAAADRYMGYWSSRIKPSFFSLLGGEPTLHPNLAEFVELAAQHWQESRLQLVTNGWFLDRHPDLPAILERYQVNFELSIHHNGEEYTEKMRNVGALVQEWESAYKLRVHWRPSHKGWRGLYQGHGPDMKPYTDEDPEASWKRCPCKWCPQILGGKIYKCPPLAYLRMVDERFGLSDDWSPCLSYRPLEPSCSDEELRDFLTRKVEAACGMCPANPPRLELACPIPRGEKVADAPPSLVQLDHSIQ